MFEVQNKTSCCKDSTKSDESKDIVSEKKNQIMIKWQQSFITAKDKRVS